MAGVEQSVLSTTTIGNFPGAPSAIRLLTGCILRLTGRPARSLRVRSGCRASETRGPSRHDEKRPFRFPDSRCLPDGFYIARSTYVGGASPYPPISTLAANAACLRLAAIATARCSVALM